MKNATGKPAVERASYSVPEAAAAIGVSSRTLWTYVKRKRLKTFRLGTRVLVPADELRRFIDEQMNNGMENCWI
jgi:excisionase family DNA binding protein